ncbi:MAG: superfamily protein [Pedosphaera sp.]|nr:superfamily protein [Pedosphaera sp.]
MNSNYSRLSAITAALFYSLAPHASADVITDWNKITVDATKIGGLNSNLGTRVGAIEAVAVYDAVNSIKHFGTPYHYNVPPADAASAEAAAAQAAHDVLAYYFPSQQAALDANLTASLSTILDGSPKENGKTVGSASAADIIALRANDGSSPNVTYPGPVAPGVGEWRPTPGATPGTFPPGINAQWGSVTPFVLAASSSFRPPPPPAVGSWKYSLALTAVKAIGSVTNVLRTDEQTHIAQFYKQDAELPVNEAARLLSASRNLSLEENALLFVLTDIAVADARIAIWEAKYTYDFWRPVTALNADTDGTVTNNYTVWNPLLVTPAHPSYPSGHSGTVKAGFAVLQLFFGDRNALILHTTTAGESPRTIQSLSQGAAENGLSRIYGGIHYSFDDHEGQNVGLKVAAYVLAHGPRPIELAHGHDHGHNQDHGQGHEWAFDH